MRNATMMMVGLLLATTIQAASHRTFVSADGTDSGACGPTTPCRTLSYALSQTNDSGEIIIIKSGGYGDANGGLAINKSISIIADPGVFAALAPTNGYDGITIDGAGINVSIKGLTINDRGGHYGIVMATGASLDLENVTVTNFSSTGIGLYVQTTARVTVKNSTFRNMYYGIRVGNGANLMLSGTRLTDMIYEGITIIEGTAGTTVVTATDTLVRCTPGGGGYGIQNSANTVGKMYLDRVTVVNCAYGIVNGPFFPSIDNVISLSNSFVSGNGIGLFNATDNTFLSSGNNHVANNGTDTLGTITTSGVFK